MFTEEEKKGIIESMRAALERIEKHINLDPRVLESFEETKIFQDRRDILRTKIMEMEDYFNL